MKVLLIILTLLYPTFAFSGVDIGSKIERIKLSGDGYLWLKMTHSLFDQYCKPGWHGFNLYIPESDPRYPYYYGLITSALANNQSLYIANISMYDGTTACDLTKTGYGIVVNKAY